MSRFLVPLVLAGLVFGCGGAGGDDDGAGGSGGDAGPCGAYPAGADCWSECGGFAAMICVDGRWDCPQVTCDPGPCPGATAPGDYCLGASEPWCEATETTAEGCPAILCSTCSRFEVAGVFFDGGTCLCRCEADRVVCSALIP